MPAPAPASAASAAAASIKTPFYASLQCIRDPFAALAEHSYKNGIDRPVTGFGHVVGRLGKELFSNPQMERQVGSVTEQGTVLLNLFKRVPGDFAKGFKEIFCGNDVNAADHESHVGDLGEQDPGIPSVRADDTNGTENRLLIARAGDFFVDKKLSKTGSDAPIFQRFMRGYRKFYHSPVGQLLAGYACKILKPILCGLELGVRSAIFLASASRIPFAFLGRLAASTVAAAVSLACSTVVAAALAVGVGLLLVLGVALAPIYVAFILARGLIECCADGVKRDFTTLRNKFTANEGGEGVQMGQVPLENQHYEGSFSGGVGAADEDQYLEQSSSPQSGGQRRNNPATYFQPITSQTTSGRQNNVAPASEPVSELIPVLTPVASPVAANSNYTEFNSPKPLQASSSHRQILSSGDPTADADFRGKSARSIQREITV